MTAAARFMAKVEKASSGCWLWIGGNNGQGYGRFSVNGRLAYAHRWAYEEYVGPIPPGYQLDHLCREPRCVNPGHLEPVTGGENVRRSSLGFELTGRCRSGEHDITDLGNVLRKSNGGRQCRPCWQRAMVNLRAKSAS